MHGCTWMSGGGTRGTVTGTGPGFTRGQPYVNADGYARGVSGTRP